MASALRRSLAEPNCFCFFFFFLGCSTTVASLLRLPPIDLYRLEAALELVDRHEDSEDVEANDVVIATLTPELVFQLLNFTPLWIFHRLFCTA